MCEDGGVGRRDGQAQGTVPTLIADFFEGVGWEWRRGERVGEWWRCRWARGTGTRHSPYEPFNAYILVQFINGKEFLLKVYFCHL